MPQSAESLPKSAALPLPGRRILVVEDDRIDRLLLWRTFRKVHRATRLEFAQTLAEARTALRTSRFHAVILDNALPDGNGVDFAMELAESGETSQLPLYILSGWPSPFMGEKASRANVRDVFSKQDFGSPEARKIIRALA
ncbi:MAG: response regulator [Pseudomonadota bacterium]